MSASLTFVTPPPGLDPIVDFTLDEVAGATGLYALFATDEPAKRFFVVDAAVHLRSYTPVVSDENAVLLGLTGPEEALLVVVANPAEDGTTVNLMAPIVINGRTGMAAQLILDDQDFPLRAPLGQAAPSASPTSATPSSVAARAKAPVLA